MSAIAGIYEADGKPVSEETLIQMREVATHRGSDGAGVWTRSSVGFAHNGQPLTNGMGFWITADCRIDNRAELAVEFENMPGFHPDLPDCAYVLQAYVRWGEEAPSRLLGDFAFAVWDERKRQLFCARDPLGVKPFFYHWDNRRFLFGSEIKQIFQASGVPTDANLAHLADLLLMNPPGQWETPYAAVQKLPPGQFLRIREGRLAMESYFEWKSEPGLSRRPSLEENARIFLGIFRQAVQDRLRTSSPHRAGSLLSGGLDSSSIVAVGAVSPPLPVFTLHFPEADLRYKLDWADWVNETPYVDRMIGAYPSLESHPVPILAEQFLHDLYDCLRAQEEPLPFPLLPCYQHLFRTASEAGAGFLLNGEGGDELFLVSGKPLFQLVSLLPRFLKVFLRKALGMDIPALIRPEFADKISLSDRLESSRKTSAGLENSPYGILRPLRSGVLPAHLEAFDRIAASNGMEVRYPFLDLRLLRFSA